MPQPVKKNIQEHHADLIKEPPIYTLLIDGGSLLMTTILADEKVNNQGLHYGGVFQFLLQLRIQMTKKAFDYVYVFFDDEYSGYKRYEIYPEYKANRDKHYEFYGDSEYIRNFNAKLKSMQKYIYGKNRKKSDDEMNSKERQERFLEENFERERDILCQCFEEMSIRWYMDEVCEGDDLISYYCQHKKENEKIVIVTGDMDISQLLNRDDICIYDLHKKIYITNKNYAAHYGIPCENILIKKIFCGDTSDNISHIAGLSENRLFEMMPEIKNRPVTVEEVKERAKKLIDERIEQKKKPFKVHENIVNGVSYRSYDGDFYEINKKIIDLSEPLMTNEAVEAMEDLMDSVIDPEDRTYENLYNLINEENIDEIKGATRFAEFFSPFKQLQEKEIKRYKEMLTDK